jgi:hypothetical protein
MYVPIQGKYHLDSMNRFTIHSKPCHTPYTVQINDRNSEEYRTHAFVFARKCDAMKMARMIEAHHRKHGTWPTTDISEKSRMHIDAADLYKNKPRLKHFYIRTWSEERLYEYIGECLLHVMFFESFKKDDVQIQFYQFEYTSDFLKNHFQKNLSLD